MARAMTEDELLQAVTDAATFMGWRWHHIRRSDKALQMGHSGFPDLVLARAGVVVFLELKRLNGIPTPDQLAWLDAINGAAPGPNATLHEHAMEAAREHIMSAGIVTPANLSGLLEALK